MPIPTLFHFRPSTALGDVDGPASSTDNAAARFNAATGKLLQDSSLIIGDGGSNSQTLNIKTVTGTKTTSSGTGTETISGVVPVGIVLGVSVRVTTALAGTGLTTFSIGDSSDADRWGTGIAKDAGTTTTIADFTITTVPIYASADNIVLTAAAGQFDSGALRYTIHYIDITAAAD